MKRIIRWLLGLGMVCCAATVGAQLPGGYPSHGIIGGQPTLAPMRQGTMNPALAPNMPPSAASVPNPSATYPTGPYPNAPYPAGAYPTGPYPAGPYAPPPASQNPWLGSFGAAPSGPPMNAYGAPLPGAYGADPYHSGSMPMPPVGPGFGSNAYSMGGFMPGGCGDPSGSCDSGCCDDCSPRWFGGVAGLIMTRNNPNRTVLTSVNNNALLDVMNSRDAKSPWNGGVEIRLGRTLDCNSAFEMSYFWIDPLQSSAQVDSPTNSLVHATSCFCNLNAGGTQLQDLADNAASHRFLRRDEIHNLELNYLVNPQALSESRFGYTGLAGLRWFRFQEGTSYGVAEGGTAFGDNGGASSAFFDQNLTSNFIGLQTGGRGYWNASGRLRLFATPKVGLGVLTVDRHIIFKRGDGIIATNSQGETMNAHFYKNDFSMLAQFDLGTAVQITPLISLYGAYRVLGVAGVGLFENNIPPESHSLNDTNSISTNASLVLHGAVVGLQMAY